jgi:hypothetical protein
MLPEDMMIEISELRAELVKKDTVLAERATLDREEENAAETAEEEESSSIAWTLFALASFLVLAMLLVTICLCCYVATMKRQRRNAMEAEKKSGGIDDSDIEASG